MRPYLRLDQPKPGVELRVLIICWQRELAIQAGIVTNPEQAQHIANKEWAKRSYLEIDSKEFLAVPGATGVQVSESTDWLHRPLSQQNALALTQANDLGIWVDGYGMVRFGGTMDLRPVREAMQNYFRQCYAS